MSTTFTTLPGLPSACTDCGSAALFWQAGNIVRNGVQDGRLKLNEVQCQFVLGCERCSETLAVVSADRLADVLNGNMA